MVKGMAKGSRKPVIWVIVGLCVAVFLMLPAVYPEARSLSYYFSRIHSRISSEGRAMNWLPWSTSALRVNISDEAEDHAPASGIGEANTSAQCSSPLLKVYMYDLPRKYNLGMIKKDEKNQEIPWTNKVAPAFKTRWQVNRQHSVEYWMMVYMLDALDSENGERVAVRVKDPEQADVFFVPFFSSLAFNTYGHGMTGPGAEYDKRIQAGVVDILKASKWWQASRGRDHVIVMHHPNAFRHFRQMFKESILIVADFGRYPKEIARLRKDVVAPYEHVVPTFEEDNGKDPYMSRKILLFFRGRIQRKDDGVVRSKLAHVLANKTDVRYVNSLASSEGLEQATKGMRSSRFCLHPAGDTPSSCRLFDAIASHCVPVIVSDRLELPFEDEIDYKEFSLFFSIQEAIRPDYLVNYLRNIEEGHWLRMWNRLKEVSHHFQYQHPPKRDDAVNMIWKQVQHKLPAVKLAMHRNQRLKIADWWR